MRRILLATTLLYGVARASTVNPPSLNINTLATPAVLRSPRGSDDATKGYLPGGVLIPIIPLNGNGGANYITAPTITAQGTCAIPWSMTLYVPSETGGNPLPGPFAVQSYTPGAQCTSGVNPYNNSNGTTVSAASFVASASASSTSLTVTSLVSGTLTIGATLTGTGLATGTYPQAQTGGTANGVGTYTLSTATTAAISSGTLSITSGGGKIEAIPFTSLWQDPNTGITYQDYEASNTGNAVWSNMPNTRILDLGISFTHAYSPCKLSGSYSGSLFIVTSYTASPTPTNPYTTSNTLTSAGSLTITTSSQTMLSNGCPDPTPIDAFCGSASVQGCKVTTLFDQVGSINKTQTALINAPDWSLVNHVGLVRPITFGSMLYTTGTGTAGQTTNGEWLQDSTEVFNPFQGTYLFAGQEALSNTGGTGFISSLDGSLALSFLTANSTVGPGMGLMNGGLASPSLLLTDNRPQVAGFSLVSNNNTASLIFSNDMATAYGSQAGASKTGEVLGAITSAVTNQLGYYDLLAEVENTSAPLTPPQLTAARAALHQQFQIIPQCDEILIISGDSTETRGNIYDEPYPRLEMDKLRRQACTFNMAVSGAEISGISGNLGSAPGLNIQSWLPALCAQAGCSSAKSVVLQLKAYPNDIRNAVTPAQIYAYTQTVTSYFKSIVPTGKVILGTAMTQGSISTGSLALQTASMQVVDAIRANFSIPVAGTAVNTDGNVFTGGLGADCLADFAKDPIFGPGSSYTSTYLTIGVNSPDHEHLYNNAENYPADIDAACYNSLLPAISTYNP